MWFVIMWAFFLVYFVLVKVGFGNFMEVGVQLIILTVLIAIVMCDHNKVKRKVLQQDVHEFPTTSLSG